MKNIFFFFCVLAVLWLHNGCARVNVFDEPPGKPVIDSLAPASGTIGTQVRLYGSGFSTTLASDTVRINGVLVRVDASTNKLLLVTLIDSTGTGKVHVTVNGQSAEGPIFTYNSNGGHSRAPVITNADHGWRDGSGYSVSVDTLPPNDNDVHLTVGGVEILIDQIIRPGSPFYDPAKGLELWVSFDITVEDLATENIANYLVTFNGLSSNVYPYQLRPKITDIVSGSGAYRFGEGDTVTLKGKFFGNGSTLPSSFDLLYYGNQLQQPAILSWTNTQIKAIMPAYPQVPVGTGMNVGIKVGEKISSSLGCLYLGNVSAKVYLIAGSEQGSNNGHGAQAQFYSPAGLAITPSGVLYVADQNNNRIRKITNITATGGDVTTVAGSTAGFNDGNYTTAQFNQPSGVAVDENGILYVADFGNNRIRILDGIASTFAGDGGSQTFWYPSGIAMNNHNLAYVSDMNNNRIRLIINQTLGTLAGGTYGFQDGTGAAARFVYPRAVALGADGTVYVADAGNHAIRKITTGGVVTTLAGSGVAGSIDGTGSAARFDSPYGIAVDAQNNVYVADFSFSYIRKITPAGVVTTFTGKFADGSGVAIFGAPNGIAVDASGALYISDAGTHRIYKVVM